MLQTSKNYNNIQEPTNKQNLEDLSQYKLQDRICHLSYRVYNMQPTDVGKNEAPFNISLNNHRKDPKAILADKHFLKRGHRFNKDARFTIIDRLTNTHLDKDILRERLIQRENFWIQKLQTLYPKGLNQDLTGKFKR